MKKTGEEIMDSEKRIISVSAVGLDAPGLVAKITGRVFKLGGNVIDVEENCRRGLFSIFLIVDFSASGSTIGGIEADLRGLERDTGLKVIISDYQDGSIGKENVAITKENHIVTILGIDQPGIIAKVSTFFADYNINIENCKMIARGTFFSMELVIETSNMVTKDATTHEQALERMKRELRELCTGLNQSVVIQSEDIYRRVKKLIVFDVESTLLQEDSLKNFLLHLKTDAGVELASLSEFKGIDMQNIVDNAKMLKGLPACDFQRFSNILDLNPGSIELITILKSMGFKIALLSSGFGMLIKKIFEKAGVDYAFSNTLKVDKDGNITGELEEPVITNLTKNEILEFIMNVEGINREQVIAVGDGATGSHFMKNVGLSIAFRPRSSEVVSDGVIGTSHIKDILFCLGVPKSDLEKVLDKKKQ